MQNSKFHIIILLFLFLIFSYASAGEQAIPPQQSAAGFYYQAKDLDARGRYDEAITEVNKALAIDPYFGKAHLMLGVAYLHKEMYAQAARELKTALSLDMDKTNQAIAHHDLGSAYTGLGLLDDAEAEFKKALRLMPNFSPSKKSLTMVFFGRILNFIPVKSLDAKLKISVFGLIFLVIIGLSSIQYIRLRRKLKILSGALQGSFSKFPFSASLSGAWEDSKFSISLSPGSEGRLPHLCISIIKASAFKMSICKKPNVVNILGKDFSVGRSVGLKDYVFDNDFLISSKTPDAARNYLNAKDRNSAVREIFAEGFGLLKIDGKRIFIRKPDYSDADLDPNKISADIRRLGILARGLHY